ncbi:MAG: flagellar biosynthetic protein FliR [Bdellovibrionota bacterium]
MTFDFLNLPLLFLDNLDVVWTFLLLALRFTGLFMFIPGLGGGPTGAIIRTPAILAIALAATFSSPHAILPDNWVGLIGQAFSEMALGVMFGIIPRMIVDGVQTAGQLSGATMGLGAAQLLDPNLGMNVSSISRVMGDLVVVVFLLLGGHYLVIHAAAGLGGQIIPGTFIVGGASLDVLVASSSNIFKIGVMVSAPVIVALLLTQFVMGLVTKAVPTVNIFIVSFPLTIGIGLVLTALTLPELIKYIEKEFQMIEPAITEFVQEMPKPAGFKLVK